MPKDKLKVRTADILKLRNAAKFADVKINDAAELGADSYVEVSYKSAQNVFDMAQLMNVVGDKPINKPKL